jgi:hypothetical protein
MDLYKIYFSSVSSQPQVKLNKQFLSIQIHTRTASSHSCLSYRITCLSGNSEIYLRKQATKDYSYRFADHPYLLQKEEVLSRQTLSIEIMTRR